MQRVNDILIPSRFIGETENALRKAGQEDYELFVLWSGRIEGTSFEVENLHVPKQKSYHTDDGLSVVVEGPELHRLNVWLYEHKQIIGAQIHAHPDDAYHSETDDTFPIATTLGSFSIVVPEFARRGLLGAGTRVFRLRSEGWVRDAAPSSELVKTR